MLPELRVTKSYKYLEVSVYWEVLEFIEIYDSRFPTCLPVATIDMEATDIHIPIYCDGLRKTGQVGPQKKDWWA